MAFLSNLVKNSENGKICIQVTHNGNTATQELPDMLATFSGEQLREYLGSKVAAMTEGLLIKAAQDRAKQKGKR
jgi:hypothetical protein